MSALHVIAIIAMFIGYGAAEFAGRSPNWKVRLLTGWYICLPSIIIAIFAGIAGCFIR